MTTAVTPTDRDPPKLSEKLEQALVEGDLSKLSAQERVQFYNATCDSLGINPLTKPFGYIVLNGKLTLYPLKACTDQLREKRGVSIGTLREEERDGLYIVFAPATDRTGRTDEDMGSVPLPESLKGEARSNAMMKAITKAKRRVTLSICGLGWLDETEVETVRGAKVVDETATVREPIATPRRLEAKNDGPGTGAVLGHGAVRPGSRRADPGLATRDARDVGDEAPSHPEDGAEETPEKIQGPLPGCISQSQIAMLMSLCHAKGVDEATLTDHLGTAYSYESKWQIEKGKELNAVMAWVAEQGPPAPKPAAKIVRPKR